MREASRPQTVNRILKALPQADYERLAPHLELINLRHGETIYETDQRIEYVYFPNKMMVSLVSQMTNGAQIEVGVIGFEGMAGLPLVLGVDRSPYEAMAQIPGGAMRLKREVLMAEFKRGGALQNGLLRYTQSLLVLASQVAACNRAHCTEERLARWLLMCHDRVDGDKLALTHEFIAMMLGVRRAGVTSAAISLQGEDFIRYSRGNITILDRPGLEDFSCECYAIIKAEFDRL